MNLDRQQSGDEYRQSGEQVTGTVRNTVNNATSKVISKKIKEKTGKTTAQFISALIKKGISGVAGVFSGGMIMTILLIIMIPVCIVGLATILDGDFSGALKTTQERVKDSAVWAYEKVAEKATDNEVYEYVKETYGCQNFDGSELRVDQVHTYGIVDDEMQMQNVTAAVTSDTCELSIIYNPDADTMAKNVAAYVTAVDGALAYYEKDVTKFDKNLYYEEDENGDKVAKYNYDEAFGEDSINKPFGEMTGETKEVYDPLSKETYETPEYKFSDDVNTSVKDALKDSDLTNTDSETFRKQLKMQADKFFLVETITELWTEDVEPAIFYEEKETYEVDGVNFGTDKKAAQNYADNLNADPASSEHYSVTNGEPLLIEHDGYRGEISIPMYFDVSSYKTEEIGEATRSLVGAGRCIFERKENGEFEGSDTCTKEEASRAMNNAIFSYFEQTMKMYGIEDLSFFAGSAIGVPGTTSTIASYSGPINYFDLATQTGYVPGDEEFALFWGHEKYLRDNNLIHGSSEGYWCTSFAQTWFYDVYGFNSCAEGAAAGTGKQMAKVIVETYPDLFEYGSSPKAGGIMSIQYLSGSYINEGHVVCIDAVDYSANSITYSECWGESYNGRTIIRKTVTLDEFYKTFTGIMTYANPK